MEETVEISPAGSATRIAQELLAVAAHPGNEYRIEQVLTTTSGPNGLAFIVPRGLFTLWDTAFNGNVPAADGSEDEGQEVKQPARRGRPPKVKEND